MPGRLLSWVVFTDLDGTLLNHSNYRWDAAQCALDVLRTFRVPLILVTSKTRAEVQPILSQLGRREPFIVENGGAIYLPTGYFPFPVRGAVPHGHGWECVALGTPRRRLLRGLAEAAKQAGVPVRSFIKMSAGEIAQRTGLSLAEARRAGRREFDEPFVILDADRNAPGRLARQVKSQGFKMTRGSRFFHILGGNDKGLASGTLTAWFKRAGGQAVRTIGLGDSPNDIPLFQAVDVPILIARPNGRYDPETLAAIAGIHRAGGAGPTAWNRALVRIFCRPDLFR